MTYQATLPELGGSHLHLPVHKERGRQTADFWMTQRTTLIPVCGTPKVMESTGGSRLKQSTRGTRSDWAYIPVIPFCCFYHSTQSKHSFLFVIAPNLKTRRNNHKIPVLSKMGELICRLLLFIGTSEKILGNACGARMGGMKKISDWLVVD